MTTAEAYLGTPVETASAAARTVGNDAAQQTAVSQGAAEVAFLTLADAEQQEAAAWSEYQKVETEIRESAIGQRAMTLRSHWAKTQKIKEAIQAAETLNLRVADGCSRSTVPCGQAEHLRQVVAAGAKLTAKNEAY